MDHDENMMVMLECVYLATQKLTESLGRFPTRDEVVEETELMFEDAQDEMKEQIIQ